MLRCIELPDFSAIGYPMEHVKHWTSRTCGIEPLRGVQRGMRYLSRLRCPSRDTWVSLFRGLVRVRYEF